MSLEQNLYVYYSQPVVSQTQKRVATSWVETQNLLNPEITPAKLDNQKFQLIIHNDNLTLAVAERDLGQPLVNSQKNKSHI